MLGQIAGAVIGGIMNRNAAKSQAAAQDRATQAQMQGYTDAREYIKDMYERGQGALDDALAAGYYRGPTYAGMDENALAGYNQMINQAGMNTADARNFANVGRGFANNYQNIYNRASQDMLGNAIDYASDSANYSPLLDAVMRDDTRNFQENTLRNNALSASASGNANSSRSAVRDAIAERAYEDRRADALTSIQNELINRSMNTQQNQLSNLTNANKNLAGVYNTGLNQMNNANTNMVTAGNAFQNDLQRQYNDNKATFEGNRDFALNTLNQYNAGILGRAPQTAGQVDPNLVDPTMAGLGGAMAGFGAGGQFGQQIMDFFTSDAPAAAPVQQPQLSYINAPAYKGFGYMGGR